jgi:hypothetical protein
VPSIRHLPESNARQGFFERPEFEALVAALPDYLKDLTRFAYLAAGDAARSSASDGRNVDRDGKAIRLRPEASKNGRGRIRFPRVRRDGIGPPLPISAIRMVAGARNDLSANNLFTFRFTILAWKRV